MIRVECQKFDWGLIRESLTFYSTSDMAIRCLYRDEKGAFLWDALYEYDSNGRPLSVLVVGEDYTVLGSIEHIYKDNILSKWQTVERDGKNVVLNRIEYIFDEDGIPVRANFFNRQEYVGYCDLYDQDGSGEYLSGDLFDLNGNIVNDLMVDGLRSLMQSNHAPNPLGD